MFTPKIIFFDIDQTLYIKNEQRIPDSTRIALKKLRERGIITAIATGRTIGVLPNPIRELIDECGIDMIVSINGQYVQYQQDKLVSFPLDTPTVERVIDALTQKNISYAFACHSVLAVSHLDDNLLAAVGDSHLPYIVDKLAYLREPVYQMLGFYPDTQTAELHQLLPDNVQTVRWHDVGADILDKHGSKARGIQAALTQLGLTMDEAMAFGDGLNDMEMIRSVAFGVAMGNAEPELKAVAQYVCPNIEDDGIYRALVDLGIID